MKWQKRPEDLTTKGSVSYATQRLPGEEEIVGSRLREGVFEIPDVLGGSSLSFLARVTHGVERSRVNLVGSPYPCFELVPNSAFSGTLYTLKVLPWARTYPFKNAKVEVAWCAPSSDGFQTLRLKTPQGEFASQLCAGLPVSALWLMPLQFVTGSLLHLFEAARTLARFDRG